MDIHTTSIPARTIVGIRRADSNPGEMFSSASEDVFAFVNRHGLQLAGHLLGIYYEVDGDRFDMAVALPVAEAPTDVEEGFFVGELPATDAVVGEYIGPYEGIPGAWSEMMQSPAFESAQGMMPCWEEYIAGPASGAPPSEWRTLFVQPIA